MKLSPSDMAVFMAEVRNRQRIYSDSTKIAQTTTNVDVFLGRIDAIAEYMDWSFAQKEQGIPITVNMKKDTAFSQLNTFANNQCLRIAKALTENAKAKRANAAKTIGLLCDLRSALKDADNKQSISDEIHKLNLSLLEYL